MNKIEIKELKLKTQGNWFQRIIKSKHNQKTLLFIFIGAVGGFLYYYFTINKDLSIIVFNDLMQHVFLGGFIGFFALNSPCARGKC